jgi:DNA topoisomerase IB
MPAATCRRSCIHPAILEAYVNGSTIAAARHGTRVTLRRAAGKLRVDEAAVLDLLKKTA